MYLELVPILFTFTQAWLYSRAKRAGVCCYISEHLWCSLQSSPALGAGREYSVNKAAKEILSQLLPSVTLTPGSHIIWCQRKNFLLNSIMGSEKKLRGADLIQEIYFLSYQTERILEYFQFLTKRISLCKIFQLIYRTDFSVSNTYYQSICTIIWCELLGLDETNLEARPSDWPQSTSSFAAHPLIFDDNIQGDSFHWESGTGVLQSLILD